MTPPYPVRTKFILIVLLMVAAALTRFIPHPSNFTAIGAMALFSGALLHNKRLAFLLPLLVMLSTDLILGFHVSMIPVYACFTFTVFLGTRIQNQLNPFSITTCSIVSSVVFYLVTNLPFWYADLSLYPLTWAGVIESYTAAIPFFGYLLAGDLFYNAVLFGSYFLISKRLPVMAN